MTPFMGVRISWLIRARKSDRARMACSAVSRASHHVVLGPLQLQHLAAQGPVDLGQGAGAFGHPQLQVGVGLAQVGLGLPPALLVPVHLQGAAADQPGERQGVAERRTARCPPRCRTGPPAVPTGAGRPAPPAPGSMPPAAAGPCGWRPSCRPAGPACLRCGRRRAGCSPVIAPAGSGRHR